MIELIKNETRNFDSLKLMREFLKDEDSRKKEKLVEFKNWKFTKDGLRITRKNGKSKTYPMRDPGMKALLKTFGMPNNFYYKKSPTDMLVRDVNRMKDEYSSDSEMLVFLQDN